jgi:hypothetical protein
MICTAHQILFGSEFEKNEMGGACSKYWERKGEYRVWWGNLRERDYLEDTGVNERTILKWIFK